MDVIVLREEMAQEYDYKTVGLKPDTYTELVALKKRGVSFDNLISQIIELVDEEDIEYSANE